MVGDTGDEILVPSPIYPLPQRPWIKAAAAYDYRTSVKAICGG